MRNPAIALLVSSACAPYPEGLRATPDGSGPTVRVDWDAEPLPDIPFPNDLATRPDPTSPTGLRLNISTEAPTHGESESREKINELVGFGIYAPLSVGFEGRLDIDDIAARHRDDPRTDDGQFEDDAFFVINVDPNSPDYLKPVELDVGHGRYPLDVPDTNRYFPNDSRSESPTLVLETTDEDLNGNGVLDWGEDTDNDGTLDKPNVWPEGGDTRWDLLEWYELESDTLIFRPVVPLREQTTYAVVLTERLRGADGEPVRSPWEWVNHTRQTEAIAPVADALPALGLSVDDVAFAWTFTTGNVTGELVDIRRGLYGEGPFATLATAYPAGITEAGVMHELPSGVDPYTLPVEELITPLANLGLFPDNSADTLIANYNGFAQTVVGGVFETPYFLVDRDDGGEDDSDEWFNVDSMAGTYSAEPQRVPFSCVLPQDHASEAPYPVVLFGHGYGSSRFDFLGFAWAFNRMGFAACAMDFPGHGPTVDPEDMALIEPLLTNIGLMPFLYHLQDSRFRDLDNDGVEDSGGDQWSADAFHTRDMVRQAAVDWMQMVRSLKECGEGEMLLEDGSTRVSCDWDNDGKPDIGGPDNKYFIVGGSLGGINAGVAAGVMPEVSAWAAIVPGGGLLDTALRTKIGGAVEAMHGRMMTPMFLGTPQDDGGLLISQYVNTVTDMADIPVATLPSVPSGGKIIVENLDKGIVREGWIPEDGTFRLSIAADALDGPEKRVLLGIPSTGHGGEAYSMPENAGLGDHFRVTIQDASGAEVSVIDTWETEVMHEGVTMEAGSPLVAAGHGTGHIRGTPELRRLAFVFGPILEPGDAISYSPLYTSRPVEALGGESANVLLVPTPGDMIVPVNTGIALARGAGYIERHEPDARYGMTQDQFLIDRKVVHGISHLSPYTCNDGAPCLFDADDFDDGTDDYGAPSDDPLRATITHDNGVGGLRLPYADPDGSHGFGLADPTLGFDINTFAIMQIASYFAADGQEISDDPCLEDASCDWIPQLPESAEE